MLVSYLKDKNVEKLWSQARKIPYNLDENNEYVSSKPASLERMGKVVHTFEKGTKRSEVWGWFDYHYSKGVEVLIYGE